MGAGDKLENGSVTLIKNGELINYSSVEEAVSNIGYDILYPSYLPDGVIIERIVLADVGQGEIKIIFVSNDINLHIGISNDISAMDQIDESAEIYNSENIAFEIFYKAGIYQSLGEYEIMKYSVKYDDYDELINILNGIKEIEK